MRHHVGTLLLIVQKAGKEKQKQTSREREGKREKERERERERDTHTHAQRERERERETRKKKKKKGKKKGREERGYRVIGNSGLTCISARSLRTKVWSAFSEQSLLTCWPVRKFVASCRIGSDASSELTPV